MHSDKIIVKRSRIDKRGIFARREFKKGQTLFTVQGPVIKFDTKSNWRRGPCWLNVGHEAWVVARPDSPWIFINHSCEPNSILKKGNRVVAIEDILPGEEITIDYSFTESQEGWRMSCKCNSDECRKVIKGIQSLPVELFYKHHDEIVPFLRAEYLKQKVEFKKHGNTYLTVAKHPLKKGELIWKVEGPTITYDKPPHYRLGFRWLGIGKNRWLIPYEQDPWNFMPHSCEPNVGLINNSEVVALKNIAPGEQLFIDDSITEADPRWKIKCKCGAKTCRDVVRSIQYLPEELYKKYLPYIPKYFQEVYEKQSK